MSLDLSKISLNLSDFPGKSPEFICIRYRHRFNRMLNDFRSANNIRCPIKNFESSCSSNFLTCAVAIMGNLDRTSLSLQYVINFTLNTCRSWPNDDIYLETKSSRHRCDINSFYPFAKESAFGYYHRKL